MDNRRMGLANANVIREGDFGIYDIFREEEDDNLTLILAIAIPVGVIVLVAIIVTIVCCVKRKQNLANDSVTDIRNI